MQSASVRQLRTWNAASIAASSSAHVSGGCTNDETTPDGGAETAAGADATTLDASGAGSVRTDTGALAAASSAGAITGAGAGRHWVSPKTSASIVTNESARVTGRTS